MVTARRQPVTQGFNCANCGAAVELRALTHTMSVACTSCGALLDPRDPNVFVLQEALRRERFAPTIPLGTRGTWDGHPVEVIGFQRRTIEVDGVPYSWTEYLLFNPYRGFRYLSEYEGHWNDIRVAHDLPDLNTGVNPPLATFRGRHFKHFQGADARTDFVLGEFPWRVRTGDVAHTDDFVAPPLMLSAETSDGERTWSAGEYVQPETVWQAFGLAGSPPEPAGVFMNQPSPHAGSTRRYFSAFFVLLGLFLLVLVGREMLSGNERVFSDTFRFRPGPEDAEQAFVTPTFTLASPGTVQIDVNANLDNSWLGLDLSLIDEERGTALDAAQELSYFHGVEGGESWTEGSNASDVRLPRVPAGTYYLRVDPAGPTAGREVTYSVTVRRDVPSLLPYLIALAVLLLPPIVVAARESGFERRRWAESDYAPDSSS